MAGINYPIYVFFGLAPSVIWLLFFLRKDSHPESNRMILKVFFCGMAAAIPVALLEIGFYEELKNFVLPSFISKLLYAFLGIALMEELFKYLVVKRIVMKDSELDEPLDLMLYMIIAALGFAAAENLLVLLPMLDPFRFLETAMVSLLRFLGATLLHALASGFVGYFLALSLNGRRNRSRLVWLGLSTAVALHGLYDLSIMEMGGNFKFLPPIVILIGLTIFVSMGFQRVKKIKSICKT